MSLLRSDAFKRRCIICGAPDCTCKGTSGPDDPAPPEAWGMFTSEKRLYLDLEDNVVQSDDPKRHKLLVHAGGRLPMEEARRYGLVKDEESAVELKPAAKELSVAKPSVWKPKL